VPERDVDAVVWRPPELVPLLRLWLGCELELDSPCDVSPEERDDDEVLAVCVVPVPCASGCDEELEELLDVVELELLVLELVVVDDELELLVEAGVVDVPPVDSLGADVEVEAEVELVLELGLVLAVCVLLEELEDEDSGAVLVVDELLVLDG